MRAVRPEGPGWLGSAFVCKKRRYQAVVEVSAGDRDGSSAKAIFILNGQPDSFHVPCMVSAWEGWARERPDCKCFLFEVDENQPNGIALLPVDPNGGERNE